MEVDLDGLALRHNGLPEELAVDLALHAAHALQRRHTSPITLGLVADGATFSIELGWRTRPASSTRCLDELEATERGAEAIALGVLHELRRWCVVRRLQRGEHADWLLVDAAGIEIAIEISGTDDGNLAERVKEKLRQVSSCTAADARYILVVRFLGPQAILVTYRGERT